MEAAIRPAKPFAMIKPLLAAAAIAFLAFAPAAAQDAGWVKPYLQRLVQPTNAARFEALKALLVEKGLNPTVHEFPGSNESKGEAGRNLVVTIGDGPRDLVVTAHYDAEKLENGTLVEGVVDNGASAVALVKLAEAAKALGVKHRLVIVFFDQEELGLLGSKAWIKSIDKSRIDAVVNFDVAGYGDTVVYGGVKNDAGGKIGTTMEIVCLRRAVDCMRFPAYPPSDDRSFAAAGVPVISIGVQPAADAHQMWLLMNRGPQAGLAQGVMPRVFTLIHTPEDKMSAIEPAAVDLAFNVARDMVKALDAAFPL